MAFLRSRFCFLSRLDRAASLVCAMLMVLYLTRRVTCWLASAGVKAISATLLWSVIHVYQVGNLAANYITKWWGSGLSRLECGGRGEEICRFYFILAFTLYHVAMWVSALVTKDEVGNTKIVLRTKRFPHPRRKAGLRVLGASVQHCCTLSIVCWYREYMSCNVLHTLLVEWCFQWRGLGS